MRICQPALVLGLIMLIVSPLAHGQVRTRAEDAACASASEVARLAYEKVRKAVISRNIRAVSAATQAFWNTEAAASDCEQVQKLAKTLTEFNLGKTSPWAGQRGSSGRGQISTGSGGIVSATIVSIELLADNSANSSYDTIGSGTASGSSASGESGYSGSGATSGSSGSSGASGSGSSSDRFSSPNRRYRITLRKDDGSIETVIQDATPDFKSGDRVHLDGDVISREN